MKNISNNNSTYFPNIDLLKGLAILSVILLHTVSKSVLIKTFSQFHIWQAVPVFFILMGFTSMLSFSHKKFYDIRTFYWRQYLIKRLKRIFVPFLIIFFVSLLFGIYNGKYYIGLGYVIGFLPVTGPGNYFITILFQYIFIAPFIYLLCQVSPKIMLITLFSINILFELIAPHISIFNDIPYLYGANILRYFSAIALGFYICDDFLKNGYVKIMSKNNKFILIGFFISIIYLFLAIFTRQPFPLFTDLKGSQNILSFFYPLVIIIFILNADFRKYKSNIIYKHCLEIGKVSYHIFLVQILWFGFGLSFVALITKDNLIIMGPIAIFANLIFIIIIGLEFYSLQKKYSNNTIMFIQSKTESKWD